MISMDLFWATVLAIVIASALDMYSTYSVFKTNEKIRKDINLGLNLVRYSFSKRGPLKTEKNPFARWFFRIFGVGKGLIIHRIVVTPIVLFIFYLPFSKTKGGFSVLNLWVFALSCIYLGIMIRQFLSEHWRKKDLEKAQKST